MYNILIIIATVLISGIIFIPIGIIIRKKIAESKIQGAENEAKRLLENASKLNVIEQVTEDMRVNEEILSNIFDSKMIDLDHMVIETKVVDGKLYVEYYDEKVLENTVEIQSDKTVRLKKKTSLFT